MSFGIYAPLAERYFAYGTFQDHESKVSDMDHRVEFAGIFKDGDHILLPEETLRHLVLPDPENAFAIFSKPAMERFSGK